MKLIVGLGNPGPKYSNNRHNAGHMFVDYLNKEVRSQGKELRVVKTDCFMNVSGKFVKTLIHNSIPSLQDLFIVHDDLDIPLGSFKIQFASGPKIHNGILSVKEELGTEEFWRVRLGVDSRPPGEPRTMSGEEYVLSDFTADELKELRNTFDQVATRLKSV